MSTAVLITLIICATIVVIVLGILIVALMVAKKQSKVIKEAQKEFNQFFKEN